MAPRLARRLLYAIVAVCVISTGAIAVFRPPPSAAPQATAVSQFQLAPPIAGSSTIIYSPKRNPSSFATTIYSLNGNSSSFSLQKVCSASANTCAQIVFRSAPP
jgi:hypothetical protein